MQREQVSTESLVVEQRGSLGVITLNRPRAVNALNYEMMQGMNAALDRFEADPGVCAVLVRGAGERGLCAGGDIVALYRAVKDDPESGIEFFRYEYALNLRLSRYPKPYIALMDGLVLGGGLGVSAHGSHRIVTERTRAGMPETVIGFSPDVGILNILARAPHHLGVLMALTGLHVSGADALAVGLADYFIPSDRFEDLVEALSRVAGSSEVNGVLAGMQADAGQSLLATQADWVSRAFSADSVEQIMENVRQVATSGAEGAEFAATVLEVMEQNSPTGMKVALEAVRRAATQSLAQTLNQDFVTTCRAMQGHDLSEGIRAQVIDKDRNPAWSPAGLEEVERGAVLAFFEPTSAGELGLA